MKIVVNNFHNLPPTVDLHPASREWVYFVEADLPEPIVKIGRAANLKKRLITLQANSPVQLKLIGAGNCPTGSEQLLHRAFAEERLFGEWFRPSAPLLTFVGSFPRGGVVDFQFIRAICKHRGMYESSIKKAFSSRIQHPKLKTDQMPADLHETLMTALPQGWGKKAWKRPRPRP